LEHLYVPALKQKKKNLNNECSSYLTVNTVRLHYENKPANFVYGNKTFCCKNRSAIWGKMIFNVHDARILIYHCTVKGCGPGSSVGIATGYGLDDPGSNTGGDEIFRPSRPALWPTQAPVKWIPGLSRG